MASNGKLTPSQTRAIAALLTERNKRQAANVARVGYRTLDRWLEQPEFIDALHHAEREAIAAAVRRLSELTGRAVETLAAVMADETTGAGTRVQAASVALSKFIDLRELHELEARLEAIEKTLAENKPR